ncbi:type II toxin-antitoxin system RelB/DinJ family antitoxin [Pantoea eucrina]|uniref:type II toxin-antitoxin system RelB/DinJ family antitoxin n=1 Tax=Pantoea eucrina TaxID=472693 RepID=UPI0024B781F2|nr:type II toxin-antitoxin system RelB/DinJ family antitoxin [Pantoea eucrina]MDJ0023610.1 type II toxin-antitoxin system RelB/DinJ family antitoxin [Pantoea eucrina]
MSNKVEVTARIDSQIKADAEAVLAQHGLTMAAFLRLSLTRLVEERAIPFSIAATSPQE